MNPANIPAVIFILKALTVFLVFVGVSEVVFGIIRGRLRAKIAKYEQEHHDYTTRVLADCFQREAAA
jgi:hypothetical protein